MSAVGLVVVGGHKVGWRPIMDCDHRRAMHEMRTERKNLRLVGVKEIFELNFL